MEDYLLVLGEVCQGGAGDDLALGDQRGTRDADDLELGRLAYVDKEDLLAGLLPVAQLSCRDGRIGSGSGAKKYVRYSGAKPVSRKRCDRLPVV